MKINLRNLNDGYLLALLSAAAVLRKEEQIKIILEILKKRNTAARKVYESLLQTYLFAGYPSAIESLKHFAAYFTAPAASSEKNVFDFSARGETNCRKIYGEKYEKLISNIGGISPDLSDWLVCEGYGKVLGRRGLSLMERELCVISILTVTKFENQLYSHINGGVRLGLNLNEIEKVIKNVDLLGKRSLSGFGLKVLNNYRERKKGAVNKTPVE